MSGEILWLTTGQWQALGTIVLVLVAGAALFLNGRSGHHAKQAAEAAEKAAQAARETAAAQMATTPVEFRLELRAAEGGLATLAVPPIRLICLGANVYVHELRLATASAGRRIKTHDVPCPALGGVGLPKLVHTGDSLHFDWPGEPPSKRASARFDVVYSFGGADTTTFTRRIAS